MSVSFWNERYHKTPLCYGNQPNPFLKSILSTKKPGKLLLPCEGTGRNAIYAAQQGWDVTAFDVSDVARDTTLQLADEAGVDLTYTVSDCQEIELDSERYDCIALIYAHFPSDVRQAFHRKCVQALKPGGHLIVECFSKDQLNYNSGGPKTLDFLVDREAIASDFEALTTRQLEQSVIHLDEGGAHQGRGAILQGWFQA